MADHFNNRIISRLRELKHEVIKPTFTSKQLDLIKSRHFQMYEALFKYLEEEKYDLLFHNNFIAVPEYFLSELKAHPYMRSKIVFFFQFREMNRSYARTLTMEELINNPSIYRAIGISMVGDKIQDHWPKNLLKNVLYSNEKIKIIHEIITEPHKNFINKIQRPHKPFTIGYFGRWSEAKGLDVFKDSMKYIDKDIKILFNIPDFQASKLREENRKIYVDNNFYPIGSLSGFTDQIDLIICPHKRSYEYGESGMPQVAISAQIPLIVPDFYFFNELIKQYEIGLTFLPEDPASLGTTINYARHIYLKLIEKARFDLAIRDYIEVEQYADAAIGEYR